MLKIHFCFLLLCSFVNIAAAQTREELEKQRRQLRKEINDAQKLLSSNNALLKDNITTVVTLSNKINLRDRIVDNLNKDLDILEDNIYTIQKDINKYDRLLDTLKQEYAKSMVYAYRNRGNYGFLNFIFSADNFNDAVKRISYLKSYRNFREMQGQNILRTQELRKKRLEDLGASKHKKDAALNEKSNEVALLEAQKKQQDDVVAQLKKKGKDINAQIAAKQRQMAKISSAVRAVIAREEEKRLAAEKDAALAAAAEKKRLEEEERVAKISKAIAEKPAAAPVVKTPVAGKPNTTTAAPSVKVPATVKAGTGAPAIVAAPASKPSAAVATYKSNEALSADFKSRIGAFPLPVDGGKIIQHQGKYKLKNGPIGYNDGITIAASPGAFVRTIFSGVVVLVMEMEEGTYSVTIRHGEYYTTYTNISSLAVKANQEVATDQVIGKVAPDFDGLGTVDFLAAKGKITANPESWLRK